MGFHFLWASELEPAKVRRGSSRGPAQGGVGGAAETLHSNQHLWLRESH